MSAPSLAEVLADVPDPRSRHGRVHPLPAVLAQLRVDATTNEHKTALRLLGLLPLAGKVVVGDAAFCQRDLAEQVVGAGGNDVLFAKGNQRGRADDVAAGFGYEAAAWSIAAPFSPGTAAAARAGGDDGGQGPRPAGEADPADDPALDTAPALAGAGAGLGAGA